MNVAVDLDGTLASWEHDGTAIGKWLPGAQAFIGTMMAKNIGVIVHTCRTGWPAGGGTAAVEKFLQDGGFLTVRVTEKEPDPQVGHVGVWVGRGKPVAGAYVDDRAVTFTGSWLVAAAQVLNRMGK